MNHTYRLVWNEGAQRHVPAAEMAHRRGKSRGGKALVRCTVFLAAVLCAVHSSRSQAAPTGGNVVAGHGTISQTGNTTTVQQQTQNLSLDWLSFSIAPSETVQFVQPSSSAVAVNRVIGNDPSRIYGHLQANGQVFLINTNGVLFGSTAQVNVGGLVASTLALTDADLRNGRYTFQSPPAGSGSPSTPASVVNEGVINASAGNSIALLGGQVSNRGVITAQLGTVALAAGSAITLEFSGNRLLTVQVDQGAAGALAENRQLIQADGGKVIMTAAARDALLNTVVNNTGVIEARTIQNEGGEITLLGGEDGGTVSVGGTLDASAPTVGNGGNIETSGAHVQVAGTAVVTTKAAQGQSGTWLIDPSDYTVAASGGDITGAALSANLNNGNVTILSSQGTANTSGNGDININDTVSWTANTALTLTAVRNININSSITASGNTAGLVLNYGSSGNYYLNNGAQVTLSGTNPSLTIGGQVFTVINSVGVDGDTSTNTLQGMQNNLSGNYALGTNIDASATAGWTSYGGFLPIGSNSHHFDGELDGLGHAISNLAVSPNQGYAGLFGYVDGFGVIRDINLSGGSALVTGTNDYVGGLVGFNIGNISNSTVIMAVTGESYVGGLAGFNSGIITNSWASGTVTGSSTATGGLVGDNIGIITNSHASATITGNSQAGGLVGYNAGVINGSYAQGAATASSQYAGGLAGYNVGLIEQAAAAGSATTSFQGAGGLVGYNSGTIQESNATGAVSLSGYRGGGLVGENTGTIEQSSATGSVTAGAYVGGLVGTNSGTVTGSNASGNVVATGGGAGGLVGWNLGTITTSYYTTGTVSAAGDPYVGGLVGTNMGGTVDQSYSSGTVNGGTNVGGLVGWNAVNGSNTGTVSNSYATGSVTGSGGRTAGFVGNNGGVVTTSYAAGSVSGPNSYGFMGGGSGTATNSYWTTSGAASDPSQATHLTGAQALRGASYGGFNFTTPIWRIYDGHTAPLLEAFLKPLTITADNESMAYNGGTSTPTLSNAVYSVTGAGTSGHLQGLSTPYAGARNAGTYTPDLWSDQQGYDITVGNSTLTINKAPLSVTTGSVAKTYDGTTSATGNTIVTGGTQLYGTDSISGGTFAYTDKNAGTNKAVTVGGVTVSDGNSGNNYSVTYVDNTTSTISKAPLTLAASGSNKTYDGTTASAGAVIERGVASGDTVSATEIYTSKDVNGAGASTLQVASGYTIIDASGANMSGNYIVTTTAAAGTITPAILTVSGATAANKTYDGSIAATVSGGRLSGVIGSDSVGLHQTGSFSDKNAGTNKPVLEVFGLTGNNAQDYTLASTSVQTTANIAPTALTITASNETKAAGAADPALTVTYSGFASGDSASSLTTVPTTSTTATTSSPAGNYAITVSGAADPNYTFTYVPGTLVVTSNPATNSPGYLGALSSLTQFAQITGDSGFLNSHSDDIELYDGMLDIDTPKRVTEALPILALIILDKGIRLPEGVP